MFGSTFIPRKVYNVTRVHFLTPLDKLELPGFGAGREKMGNVALCWFVVYNST